MKAAELLIIYEKRYEIGKEENQNIYGFDELLPKLRDNSPATSLLVHEFYLNSQRFIFFTDSSVKLLIGYLMYIK
jgi:hypothetical protein